MSDTTHVYVIAEEGGQFLKVGIARDPIARLGTLQTSNARKLNILKTYDYPTRDIALAVESKIHRALADCRARGEWFACHPNDVMHVWWIISDAADVKFKIDRPAALDDPPGARMAFESRLFVIGMVK